MSAATEQTTAAVAPAAAASQALSGGGGVTFVVEDTITPAGPGSYGKTRNYREPSTGHGGSLRAAWESIGGVEAMSPPPTNTVDVFTKQNMLVKAVHTAFFEHHPLILTPDIIWLTIAQGLANHVDQNAEDLREHFVSHTGKAEIEIVRPEFVKGSPRNDWEGVFPEFAAQITANTAPGTAELITADFTTTTAAARIVSQITLMDTVQHFFSYSMACGCGFPSITLRGTPGDWEALRAKAAQLAKYDLDWWLVHLLPALDHFVSAAHGAPDLDFWRSLCHINVGTSMPNYKPLTGWVNVFFPYLNASGSDWDDCDPFAETEGGQAVKKLAKNDAIGGHSRSMATKTNVTNFGDREAADEWAPPSGTEGGVKLEMFPPSMSSAPFVYKDALTRKTYSMAFMGGLTALVQHPDGAIEPTIGWAVMDAGPAPPC
eukprot:m.412558 g.412558  ORF g.412558 m.412558 type:complete len:431 (-) comp28878_c0_seq1:361-1653(-)